MEGDSWANQGQKAVIDNICGVGYIGEFEVVDDHRAGKIVVELNGRYAAVKEGVGKSTFNINILITLREHARGSRQKILIIHSGTESDHQQRICC